MSRRPHISAHRLAQTTRDLGMLEALSPQNSNLAHSTAMRGSLPRALNALGSDGGLDSRRGLAGSAAARGRRPNTGSNECSGKPAPSIDRLTGFDLLCILMAAAIWLPLVAALVSAAGQL